MIHVNEDHSDHVMLNKILTRLCNVVAFYELATKVNDTVDSADFYILLSEIILDGCKWVRLLFTLCVRYII